MVEGTDARPDGPIRLLSAGAGLIGLAVLLDSALEHYRGSFRNPAMILPLAASAAALRFDASRLTAGEDRQPVPIAASLGQAGSVAVGLMGLGFHVFNIDKRPGGFSFGNLFYGAPLGAPAALILAGTLGAAADALGEAPRKLGSVPLENGRVLGALAAVGIIGTVGEAGLLHFRGAYHNPAMWLPVALPPVAALSLSRDVMAGRPSAVTAGLLGATALLGIAGVAFHVYGVSRNMGGWRNWRQNMLAGPPIPAPPAFTGLAIAAIGALILMKRRHG